MQITKLGHCCLLIKQQDLTILTDPGTYTTAQDEVKGIDIVLITHEHPDHLHLESVKKVLANNPATKIITNSAVSNILAKENIKSELLEHGNNTTIKEIAIEAFGEKHAVIYPTLPQVQNTGYFIANRFFYPGDALTHPGRPVEILALPVAGPWLKIAEAVDYAVAVKPKICFPVHDGNLKNPGITHRAPQTVLESAGIDFKVLAETPTEL